MAFKSNFKKILALVLGIASFGANSKNNVQAKSQSWIANNPVKSALIGALGLAGIISAGEIIRRNFFNEKFGYDAEKDCVYKRKSGKVDIVIIGSLAEDRKQFINDIKNNKEMKHINVDKKELPNRGLADYLEYKISRGGANGLEINFVSDERAKISNWNIIEKDLNKDNPDEIANLLKNDVTMAIFMVKQGDQEKISEILNKSFVSKVIKITDKTKNNLPIWIHEDLLGKRGFKSPAYFPVNLYCGNENNGVNPVSDNARDAGNDEGMSYDTIKKEYVAARCNCFVKKYTPEEIEKMKKEEEKFNRLCESVEKILNENPNTKVDEIIIKTKASKEDVEVAIEIFKDRLKNRERLKNLKLNMKK